MRTFVTGGSGFIGSWVIRQFLARGYEVVSYDLAEPRKMQAGAKYVVGTILDEYLLRRSMEGCNSVVHLAAMMGVRRTTKDKLICLNVNILGTQRVLEAAAFARVGHVMVASSSEVFGDFEGTAHEEYPFSPKSEYAISKLAAEQYAMAYAKEYGLDYTIVRFFSVYGPGQVAEFVIPRFVKARIRKESLQVYGSGDQIRSFCNVKDASWVVAELVADTSTYNETFNVGNDQEPITMVELAKKVATTEVHGHSGACVAMIPFAMTDRTLEREIFRRVPNISKLRSMIGYIPKVTLDEGIRELLIGQDIPDHWQDSEIPKAWEPK